MYRKINLVPTKKEFEKFKKRQDVFLDYLDSVEYLSEKQLVSQKANYKAQVKQAVRESVD